MSGHTISYALPGSVFFRVQETYSLNQLTGRRYDAIFELIDPTRLDHSDLVRNAKETNANAKTARVLISDEKTYVIYGSADICIGCLASN